MKGCDTNQKIQLFLLKSEASNWAAFGLSLNMIICDVVVIKTIFKSKHQKTFHAIPERVYEVFPKKINAEKLTFYRLQLGF